MQCKFWGCILFSVLIVLVVLQRKSCAVWSPNFQNHSFLKAAVSREAFKMLICIELKGSRRPHHATLKTSWTGGKPLFSKSKVKGEYWFAKFEDIEIFISIAAAAAAAKSLQSCPTLCNPIDGSSLGSSVPGILQARILEWGAIAFSVISIGWLPKLWETELRIQGGKVQIWNVPKHFLLVQ